MNNLNEKSINIVGLSEAQKIFYRVKKKKILNNENSYMKPILLDNSKLKSYKYCHGRVRNGSVPKVFNEEYMRLEKTSKDL